MDLSTLSIAQQIALLVALSWLLPKVLLPVMQLMDLCATAVARQFARPKPRTRVPHLRQAYGSSPRQPDYLAPHLRVDRGFQLLEARRIQPAKRVLRRILSDGAHDPRTLELRTAIRVRERQLLRKERRRVA